ncbi:hypothetical protein CRENBAI_006310 [Crenichthys baileyi]|uniref:Uncharacterized protein n=1 Tax=Crenichthys baileyi TaxID=28760 RepID=A0AAV9RUS3_9TELE
MVNTSLNFPQPEDRSGSIGSDCKIAPRFTCPACPPSNAIHHLEEPALTACLPVNLNLHGLPTSPQNQHTHPQSLEQQQASTNLALVEISRSIQTIQNHLSVGTPNQPTAPPPAACPNPVTSLPEPITYYT